MTQVENKIARLLTKMTQVENKIAWFVDLPPDMDIPLMRRDTTKPENVRWLLRNLQIQNRNHPTFDLVVEKLRMWNKEIQK